MTTRAYLLLQLVHGVATGVGIFSEDNPTTTCHHNAHFVTLWREDAPTYAAAQDALLQRINDGLSANWPGPIGRAVTKLRSDSRGGMIEWADVLVDMPAKTRTELVRALAKTDAVHEFYVEADKAESAGRTDSTRWHNPDDVTEITQLRERIDELVQVNSYLEEVVQDR